ncbi:MAG: NHL repeat-containing protein, partial [Nocardioidaceae bacterium]
MTGRSFVLDSLAGWRDEAQLCESVASGAQLRLSADTDGPFALNDPTGGFGGLADPTGAAMDAEGRAYRIDAPTCRLQHFTCDGWAPVPCVGALTAGASGAEPQERCGWRGVTTTPRGDVVVADSANRRLVVFAADGVALRRIIGPPAISPQWTPWDVAVWRGRILVSDRSGGLVHVLTCDGDPVAAWDGSGDDPAAPPLTAPTALAVDRSGRIYVAQDGDKAVRVLDSAGRVVEMRETTE